MIELRYFIEHLAKIVWLAQNINSLHYTGKFDGSKLTLEELNERIKHERYIDKMFDYNFNAFTPVHKEQFDKIKSEFKYELKDGILKFMHPYINNVEIYDIEKIVDGVAYTFDN